MLALTVAPLCVWLCQALLWLPDVASAEEMVKVHTVTPVKMEGSPLEMVSLRLTCTLKTPVSVSLHALGSPPLVYPPPLYCPHLSQAVRVVGHFVLKVNCF